MHAAEEQEIMQYVAEEQPLSLSYKVV